MRERLIQLLSRYFNIGDSYTYNLTRVKTAFDVGTVDIDDFEEYTEDDVANLTDHLLDNGVIVPQVKVGQTVWYIGGAITSQVHPAKITDIHYNGKTFVYRFVYRVEAHGYLCFKSAFGSDDDNEEIYTTREAAEAALKARENK